jgi:hypothetical protein
MISEYEYCNWECCGKCAHFIEPPDGDWGICLQDYDSENPDPADVTWTHSDEESCPLYKEKA